MSNFHDLAQKLLAMQAQALDPSNAGAVTPLALGEFVSAGALVTKGTGIRLHRQPRHEELLIVLAGEADFRLGDETRRVRAGNLIFVPRNTVHGTVATHAEPLSFLSILAPQFDLTKDVRWEDDAEPPRYQLV
jgi:quercetin dioxygenase-like cupin family protein